MVVVPILHKYVLAHLLIRDDHEVDGLEMEWGSPGRIFAYDKVVQRHPFQD